MAKVTIAGQAVVITSEFKLEELAKIEKYRPDTLTLKGGEDGKEPIFRIVARKGAGGGEINRYGATFTSESNDDAKLATITMAFTGAENVQDFVAEELGGSIINLNKLEASLNGVLGEIDAEKALILESITVVQ